MQTKLVQARRVHAGDHLVTGGEGNPLHPGGRRRAWQVAEARRRPLTHVSAITIDGPREVDVPGTSVCEFRAVIRSGAADGGDAWLIIGPIDSRGKVRVLA
jgi:hypothetical protein